MMGKEMISLPEKKQGVGESRETIVQLTCFLFFLFFFFTLLLGMCFYFLLPMMLMKRMNGLILALKDF